MPLKIGIKIILEIYQLMGPLQILMKVLKTNIINLSEKVLGVEDAEIEVEYQSDTIGKYHLDFNEGNFLLTATTTNCLASDKCGIPPEKLKISLNQLQNSGEGCCAPGGKCC